MRAALLVPSLLALAGCAGAPSPGSPGTAQPAVSQQASSNDARQRAKVHTELGALYLEDGRFSVAQDEARIAMDADPAYAPAYNLMALVHMYLRENDAADDFFGRALRLAPNDPEINNNYGWFLCQTERAQQAVPHFMSAVKNPLYTTPAKALTSLGLCYLKMKDDRAAEDFLGKALRADGNNTLALYSLADIQYRGARYDEARRSLADLHKLMEPNSQSLWLALRVERKIGDREAEVRHTTQLRRKFQGSPEYQKLMQGQYE